MSAPLLEIKNLGVAFRSGDAVSEVVNDISLSIQPGETLALVGESGSGKSVTALSILKLLPSPPVEYPQGQILWRGVDLLSADEATLRSVRGKSISMIFQEPMTSLNPLHTIGAQVGEVLEIHRAMRGDAVQARVIELLTRVGIRNPETRLGDYPHQLSGGQRQRVMIAMALANEPDLLIADEPTTALDVTVQAQILKLLKDLQAEMGLALLLITHDLGIVRAMAARVAVMQKGRIVETGPVEEIFTHPRDPYTKMLIAAEPKGLAPPADPAAAILMEALDLKVWYPVKRGFFRRTVAHIKAVDGVNVCVRAGQTLGVVGESGSGKTTLGLALLRLIPSQGTIVFMGQRIDTLNAKALRPIRKSMQIVFQDPYGSLSPRMSIEQIIEEGLSVQDKSLDANERETRVRAALEEVGLDPAVMHRYPHEFSGGQRQRIALARALVLKPAFVVLDEPTSALDMSVQAQIVDLLRTVQARHGIGYLFISHDLRVVRALAHHVIVMQNGKAVESGPSEQIFTDPQTDYTRALLAAALDHRAVPTVVRD